MVIPNIVVRSTIFGYTYTPCPRKKGATDFFAVTFTNIDGFS